MAPLPPGIPDCPDVAPETPVPMAGNTTQASDRGVDQDDLSALLYIVVTLLFYSMGIVVGIITYLKRERADMEEEMIFDMYLTMKRDPFNVHRQERVQQMARRLDRMEREKADREGRGSGAAVNDANDSESSDSEVHGDGKKCNHVKISDCVPKRSPSTRSARKDSSGTDGEGTVLVPLVLSTATMLVGSTTGPTPVLHVPSPLDRPAVLLTRPAEHERRGALPMGASALHVTREAAECRDSGPETALLVSGPVVNKPLHDSHSQTKDSFHTA
ncbi:uncharacterized protein LOC143280228 [Babylonia areolata]|uniref:uncharacterized protein LOC143280228 n=1 Tax=Babylonia areolata TaxID=304850 RepID=UPI003FD59303